MIARFILVLIASFVLSTNADRYEHALKRIQNQFDKIEKDDSLDWRTKHMKLMSLYDQMNTVLSLKERALQNIINKKIEKEQKLQKELEKKQQTEALVYKKYLAGKSSFHKDFHTIRY